MKTIFKTTLVLAVLSFVGGGASFAYIGESMSKDIVRSMDAALPAAGMETSGTEVASADAAAAMLKQDSKWQFKPGLAFNTAYDSNVNRERSGERNEDIIFETRPSFKLLREGGIVSFTTGYELNYQKYLRSKESNIFNHDGDVGLKIQLSRLKIMVDEAIEQKKTRASSEQSEKSTILTNSLKNEVGYDLTDSTNIAALYQNSIFRYGETILKENSYLINKYGGRFSYHASTSLDLFFDGGFHETRYYRADGKSNSEGFWVGLGAKGILSPRTAVNFNGGFKRRAYDVSDFPNDNNFYAEGGVRYRLTPLIDTTLLLKRDVQESISAISSRYRANRAGVDFKYKATSFINMTLGTYAQINEFTNNNTVAGRAAKDRTDWLVGANAGIEWEPWQYFFLNLKYELSLRTTNSNQGSGYTDHLVTTGLAYRT